MGILSEKYKLYIRNKKFLIAVGEGFLILLTGVIITTLAIIYATEKSSNSVTDIILNNIPVFDVDWLFVYAPLFYWLVIIVYLVCHPNKLPFSLKTIGIFLIIRSIFMSLTHLGPSPDQLQIDVTGIFRVFTSGADLFFSGHAGLPFLMALLFWDNKYLRLFFIFSSIFLGAVVLLGHMHYSIDVFAAFFITYTIFHIAEKLFKKDRQIFMHGL